MPNRLVVSRSEWVRWRNRLHVLSIVAFFLCVLEYILRDSTDSLHGRHRYMICRYEIQVLVGVRHIFRNGGAAPGAARNPLGPVYFFLSTTLVVFFCRDCYIFQVFSLIDACVNPSWVVGLRPQNGNGL
ncbi:unnamed protein product [Ectocarpus sp. 12 AP-2014]